MNEQRDAFILRYLPLVNQTVDCYLAKHPGSPIAQLEDDMKAEGNVALILIADKFFSDDGGQVTYVENYIRRTCYTKCVDVIRRNCQENDRILGILKKYPFAGSSLFVLDVTDLHDGEPSFGDLARQIRQKQTVNWTDYLDPDEAAIVEAYLATYATRGGELTYDDHRIHNRLRHRVKRLVAPLLQ